MREMTERYGAEYAIRRLGEVVDVCDDVVLEVPDLMKIENSGDGHYVAACGVPRRKVNDASKLLDAAAIVMERVTRLSDFQELGCSPSSNVSIKIALHVGTVNFGVIGYVTSSDV